MDGELEPEGVGGGGRWPEPMRYVHASCVGRAVVVVVRVQRVCACVWMEACVRSLCNRGAASRERAEQRGCGACMLDRPWMAADGSVALYGK